MLSDSMDKTLEIKLHHLIKLFFLGLHPKNRKDHLSMTLVLNSLYFPGISIFSYIFLFLILNFLIFVISNLSLD